MLDKDGNVLLSHIDNGYVAIQRNEEDKVYCESCQNHLCQEVSNNACGLYKYV